MKIAIQGWRNLSHSFCLVNQFQLLNILDRRNLSVSHADLPMYRPDWSSEKNPAGFPSDWQDRIDAIPRIDPSLDYDLSYSIAYPFFQCRADVKTKKHVAFVVTELGLTEPAILSPAQTNSLNDAMSETDFISTPSNWSRERIAHFGVPDQKVKVIPHGVDWRLFTPLKADDRHLLRGQLNIAPHEFCILNVGAATWNKGVEPLIRAFVILRRRHSNLRLILKDHSSLYGIKAHSPLMKVLREFGHHNDPDMLASVSVASKDFSLEQLRGLYSAADCYVSSYRAEGFNLPVLEAMACGIPVLATAGGATDDFVHDPSARIAARQVPNTEIPEEELRKVANLNEYYLEPELDDLVAKLEQRIASGPIAAPDQQLSAWALENFSWQKAVDQLLALPN